MSETTTTDRAPEAPTRGPSSSGAGRAGRTVKIVALTAHAMESARRECMEAGCDDFATKPVDFAGLVALIEKYTGVLAAADVFTESTTFQVMQSIRLDLGYGSWVHP